MTRPTSALIVAILGTALGASVTLGQQAFRSAGSNPDEASPSLDPMSSARGVRTLLRNGLDYLSYQDYDRALKFLREAEGRQKELSPNEVRSLKKGIEQAQQGLREAGNSPRRHYAKSHTPRAGAIAVAQPPTDSIQLAAATTTTPAPAQPTSVQPGNVPPSPSANPEPAPSIPTSVVQNPSERPVPQQTEPAPLPSLGVSPGLEPAPAAPAAEPAASNPTPAAEPQPAPMPLAIAALPPSSGSTGRPAPEPIPSVSAPPLVDVPQTSANSLSAQEPQPALVPSASAPQPVPSTPTSTIQPSPPAPNSEPEPAPPLPETVKVPNTPAPEPTTLPVIPEEPAPPATPPEPLPAAASAIQTQTPAADLDLPPLPPEATESTSTPSLPASQPAESGRSLAVPTPEPEPVPAVGTSALPLPPALPDSIREQPGTEPAPGVRPRAEQPSGASRLAPGVETTPRTRLAAGNRPAPMPAFDPSGEPRSRTAPVSALGSRPAPSLLPRVSTANLPSTLPPHLQRRVEEVAELQEDELRRRGDVPAPSPGTTPSSEPMPGLQPVADLEQPTTRLELPRAPSPTEARPLRAIEVPEEYVPLAARNWDPNRKYWAAAATCHMPLYFQDAVLERYGYSMEQRFGRAGRFLSYPIDAPKQSKQRNQIVQPLFSFGLYVAQIVALPYNMIMDPPWEAEYDLGYHRPGDRVPTDVFYLPLTGVGPPLQGKNY